MKVRMSFLDTVRFAADDGAGSGAPPAPAAPAAEVDPFVESLVAAGKAGAAKMRPPDEAADERVDEGDRLLPGDILTPAGDAPVALPTADEGEEAPAGDAPATDKPADEPPAGKAGEDAGASEALRKITVTVAGEDGSKRDVELTESDVIALAQGYEEYHKGHEGFLKLKTDLEEKVKAHEERMKGPDGVILAALDKYPQLAEGLQKLIDEIPELKGEVGQADLAKTVAELQAELKALKEGRESDKTEAQKERDRQAGEERKRQQETFQKEATRLRSETLEKAKGAGLPERVANRIIDAAVAGLNLGKIKATVEDVQKFLTEELSAEIQERKGLSEAATREYLNKKRAVPPAPPRGGNAPPPTRKPPTNFGGDLRRAVHAKLRAIGANG